MLIQFTVGNFLSFKEKTTFSMVASPDEPGHEDRVVKINDDLSVLRIAAIYGANAAGKTNLIKAIINAKELIRRGTNVLEPIPYEPFLLSEPTENNDSYFEFVFSINETVFIYGFTNNGSIIGSEWLINSSIGVTYFERNKNEKNDGSAGASPGVSKGVCGLRAARQIDARL